MPNKQLQPKILVAFHTPCNAGYAMAALEKMFFDVALDITNATNNVHFSFQNLESFPSRSLPHGFENVIALDFMNNDTYLNAENYIKTNGINCVLCFDVQPSAKVCQFFRKCGIKKIVSYWGSSMSNINYGLKLWLKKLEVLLNPNKPDHFVFESNAMRNLAVFGRGIANKNTSVIPTGVDIQKYKPDIDAKFHVVKEFGFPVDAKIIFYSGHMETRKGVHVIIHSAIELVDKRGVKNIYFLICGNRPGEEKPFLDLLQSSKAKDHVVFAGYRSDLPQIMPGCEIGVVASTGWDSFPMSTLEMAASGLPIVVSRLQGLVETVEDGITGFEFEPGDHLQLADRISELLSSKALYAQFSANSLQRIKLGYTTNHQFSNLKITLANIFQ